MRTPRTALLAIAAVALAVAGCGGGEVSSDEVPGSPPALTVPSDSELGAPETDTSTTDPETDEDATTDPDAAAEDPAATEEPVVPDDSSAPVVPAEPETGGTVPEEPQAAVPEDTTAPPAAPEEAPTDQFDNFCEQNVGAC